MGATSDQSSAVPGFLGRAGSSSGGENGCVGHWRYVSVGSRLYVCRVVHSNNIGLRWLPAAMSGRERGLRLGMGEKKKLINQETRDRFNMIYPLSRLIFLSLLIFSFSVFS